MDIITDDMPYVQIAKSIWNTMEVMERVEVFGFEVSDLTEKVVPKGEYVIGHLKDIYISENCTLKGTRINVCPPNSIGGSIAHKIFRWDKRYIDNEPRYTIWRIQ